MNKFKENIGIVNLAVLLVLLVVSLMSFGRNQSLGIASNATKFTNLKVTNEIETTDLTVLDDVSIAGDLALTGDINSKMPLTSVTASSTATVTTTLTTSMSGETFLIAGTTSTFILPATSTSAGTFFRFNIGGAITGNSTIVTSDAGNWIEGTLIVAGAVVDCDAEDTLTFVADGENLGDYVEVYSNGTNWFILDSGVKTGSKLTCTAS